VETDAGRAGHSSSGGRTRRAAEAALEAGWLAAVLLVPLAVNPWGFNYELPKVALFRALTLFMAAAHILSLGWSPPPQARRWLRLPLIGPILLLAAALLLSLAASISPRVSLWGTAHRQQGAYLLLCYLSWALIVAGHIRSTAQRRRLAAVVVVAGTLVAITPVVETIRWQENLFAWRPGGSLGNPIFLGAYLIMALPFTVAALIRLVHQRPRKPIRIAACSLGLAVQLFALFISQSRGPWLGGLAALALFAWLMLWREHRRALLAAAGVTLLAAAALLLGLNFGLSPSSPLASLPYVERVILSEDAEGGTVRVRLLLWQAAAKVVTTWPQVGLEPHRLGPIRPLLGYGPDTAVFPYTTAYPPELAHIEDPAAIWDRAHNETLDLLAMTGWLGIAANAVLAAACVRRGQALWSKAAGAVERAWVAAPLAALLAHAVEVQFAFSLTGTGMMTWLCIAWLASPALLSASAQETSADKHTAAVVQPHRRWRAYAVIGTVLLVALALRLEGGALWADTLLATARDLDQAGEWGKSITTYDQALAIVPWQPSAHQLRAETLYNLARALPEQEVETKAGLLAAAESSLARAIELEPLELEHYSNSGVLHAYWSEAADPTHLDTAVAYYELAFRLAPTRAELRLDLGHVYHNHGMYELALEQYQAALAIDPQLAQAHYDSGLGWLALGRRDEARAAFQAALELAPACQPCAQALQELSE
jgi:tetratricopeptide (TPR) repeat protein